MFDVNPESDVPKYKQILAGIESQIASGVLRKGMHLPSMNDIATETGISKETVKRALVNLRDRGYIASCPGKGYYVFKDADELPQTLNILMIIGRLDIFKQLMVDAFTSMLRGKAEVKILLHNSDVDQLEAYLEQNLDKYDYYVISPHFPLDEEVQRRVARLLSKVPNRKLLQLDHYNAYHSGQFGAVYQDFLNDPGVGLAEGLDDLRKARSLNVVMLPSSRYGGLVLRGVERFCSDYDIPLAVLDGIPRMMSKGDVFLLLTGRLSNELAEFDVILKENSLEIGRDIGLISYNDVPLNAVVLGGLTTISTDFVKMGELAAQMILNRKMEKIRNPFRMIRRKTF